MGPSRRTHTASAVAVSRSLPDRLINFRDRRFCLPIRVIYFSIRREFAPSMCWFQLLRSEFSVLSRRGREARWCCEPTGSAAPVDTFAASQDCPAGQRLSERATSGSGAVGRALRLSYLKTISKHCEPSWVGQQAHPTSLVNFNPLVYRIGTTGRHLASQPSG